jgi:hypothetical protein
MCSWAANGKQFWPPNISPQPARCLASGEMTGDPQNSSCGGFALQPSRVPFWALCLRPNNWLYLGSQSGPGHGFRAVDRTTRLQSIFRVGEVPSVLDLSPRSALRWNDLLRRIRRLRWPVRLGRRYHFPFGESEHEVENPAAERKDIEQRKPRRKAGFSTDEPERKNPEGTHNKRENYEKHDSDAKAEATLP